LKSSFKRFDFTDARTRARRAPFSVPFLDLILLFGFSLYLSQNQQLNSQGLAVELPPVSTDSGIIDSRFCHGTLFIGINGMLFLNGERLSFETLDQALVRLKKPVLGNIRLLVQSDRQVSIESFVRICDALRARKIETILLGVNPKSSLLP
jgi:biopolymer transport protein ExbD|tara:strand:- start:6798 stop:7250 length:453 start_codon:yes stop_codon:yes gene_type:complete